jgi:hypothetical protein
LLWFEQFLVATIWHYDLVNYRDEGGHLEASSYACRRRIRFDVRQNRCTKELLVVPHPGRQSKTTIDAGSEPNDGNQALLA